MSSGVGRQTGVKFTAYEPQTNHSQGLPAAKAPAFCSKGHPQLQRHLHGEPAPTPLCPREAPSVPLHCPAHFLPSSPCNRLHICPLGAPTHTLEGDPYEDRGSAACS